jgi:hypothetical protein
MSKKIIESYKQKLATEEGFVVKHGAGLRVALCYPNTHSIGMANLGMHTMYELFNKIPEVSCERVFLPDDFEMREYEKTRTPLLSLETQTPIRDFDVVAFSISFDTPMLRARLFAVPRGKMPIGRPVLMIPLNAHLRLPSPPPTTTASIASALFAISRE